MMRVNGAAVECIEVYPTTDDTGHTDGLVITLVGLSGRTLVTDRVFRRDHQTVLSLLYSGGELIRHLVGDST